MNLSVSSAFDGGNIRLVAIDGNRVDLEIVKDNQSDFYHWFYFRLTGARDQAVELFAPFELRAYDETTFDVPLPMGPMRAGVYWFHRPGP